MQATPIFSVKRKQVFVNEASQVAAKRIRFDCREHSCFDVDTDRLSDIFGTALRVSTSLHSSSAKRNPFQPICRELPIKVYDGVTDWNASKEITFHCLPNGDLDLKPLGQYLGAADCCQASTYDAHLGYVAYL